MTSSNHDFMVHIEPDDIDFMGHVNNATYLNWVQSAVIAHWERVAGPENIVAYLFVALKHEITYHKPAFLNDTIVATAILEEVRRESALYETIIRRGEEILARVKSRWCCLDATTLRPTRLGGDVIQRFLAPAT